MSSEERWHPISVMLSMYGSRINSKLLFRYPFTSENEGHPLSYYTQMTASTLQLNKRQVGSLSEDMEDSCKTPRNEIEQLESFSDELLGHILSPGNTKVCGKEFDLKINGIRFTGYPLMMEQFSSIVTKFDVLKDYIPNEISALSSRVKGDSTLLSFNIVFVLKATAEYAIVERFQELALQLGIALRFEEKCCQYLTEETRLMLAVHDEVSLESESMVTAQDAYGTILKKSRLAMQLTSIFNNLRETGVVSTRINNSTLISFCLPHKVHNLESNEQKSISVDSVERVIKEIRPYHGVLIYNKKEVWSSLPDDYSPALTRFLTAHEPIKSVQSLSSDTDLPLTHVYELASRLVYWGKAMVIYPLCDSNMYMAAPCADFSPISEMAGAFSTKFNRDLRKVMSNFALPVRLSDLHQSPHEFFYGNEEKLIQIVFWLLQHRFLIQMHTYIFFSPDEHLMENDGETSSIAQIPLDPEVERVLINFPVAYKDAILSVPASTNPKDLRLLVNLLKYFDGNYHMEEIMYSENLTRPQLLKLLDKFGQLLVTNLREDDTTAAFCM